MSDMSAVIVPKSDQINADDLLSGPMTIKINNVKITGGKEQPVSMYFEGSDKAYRPCKSMCRVIVSAWGANAAKYVGRSMTLYCDPHVKWAGMEVGGIRISHMSDIATNLTMALTVTRANKKPFTVKPLVASVSNAAPPQTAASASRSSDSLSVDESEAGAAPDELTAQQAIANIERADGPESLSLAAELARTVCKSAPDKLAASSAYRTRLAQLKAMADEVEK